MPRALYVNSNTATDDTARRFEEGPKDLHDVILCIEDNAQLLGDAEAQTFPLAADTYIGITHIDIAKLYFRNETAGANGTIHVIGVEE